ncbi:AEC family transporter [Geminocystis sp. NIES-3709]|uniref:AEC family transporter n=1 Tax=Geminocystis sp. NIES-3709 TaxID=1617448 RepID=UPI0005FC4B00|nr:AEC family transporter [Geminocystis sp. NIES-3709]BAQ64477.1 transporter [Geminocystis sp. NIES-3709]
MNIILSSVLPVGLIIAIGYIAGQRLKLDQSTLSQVSVYILAPALIADGLYRSTISAQSAFKILLAYILTTAILYGGVFVVGKLLKLSQNDSKGLLAITLCPNNGNMGLSIIAFALGDEGLERAIIYMIFSSIVLFGMLPGILKGDSFLMGLKVTWKLPLIWAMLFGIVLNVADITLPFNLGKSLEWLGISAIPIALIILGMQLNNTKLEVSVGEMGATFIRLAIAPIIAYGIGILVGLTGLDLQALTLQTAMPTAVNAVIMIKEFGGNTVMVARTIIISTVMSFATLPLIIWLIT